MDIRDLTLAEVSDQMRRTASLEIVAAMYAARLGWSDTTCCAFVASLVLTDNLRNREQWPVALRKIRDLMTERDLAALNDNRVVSGDVE
jgi:hypothetical protein